MCVCVCVCVGRLILVSNLQHYPYATITNKTPYATHQYLSKWSGVDVYYASTKICSVDYINEGIASGGKWTASSRGVCLITIITAVIALPSLPDLGYELFTIYLPLLWTVMIPVV